MCLLNLIPGNWAHFFPLGLFQKVPSGQKMAQLPFSSRYFLYASNSLAVIIALKVNGKRLSLPYGSLLNGTSEHNVSVLEKWVGWGRCYMIDWTNTTERLDQVLVVMKHEKSYKPIGKILRDKMNYGVGLGKLLSKRSTGVPALLPCAMLPKQHKGTNK